MLFCAGVPEDLCSGIEWLNFGEGLCGRAAQQRCYLQPESIQQSNDPSVAFLKSIGIDAFCCYPLITDGKLLGTLSFGTKRSEAFDPSELEMLRAMADEVAVALDRILLIEKLAESNRKLAEMNADLRRVNFDLEQFVFSASHALREPLRDLAIHSELLRRRAQPGLDEGSQQWLSVVLRSAERMEALFRDLMAFIQVTRSHAAPQTEADSNVVLDHVLATLEGAMRNAGATVNAEVLPAVCMDGQHLFQVFRNLIENAIKYQAPGVTPEIQVYSYDTGDDAVICVRDNGMGIAARHQERVFELFKRLHTSEEYEGTGLGLAICQKIVEQHGGRIWVESELGKGAVFCFRVRRASDARKTMSAKFADD